jgi:hypothetical protein
MPDSPPASAKKPDKPGRTLNRWGVGTLSLIQVGLLLLFVCGLNYLSSQHFFREDLSREGNYTLSKSTVNYLTGTEMKARPTPVKWIMAFTRSSPFYERVRALAEEYARLSNGKIELEILDPLRSPDRTQQAAATYGISLIHDLLIIDARTDESAVTTQDNTGTRTLNPNVKIVIADDLVVYSTDQGQRRPTGFQGEDILTANLVEAVEGRPRKMLLLSDKSRLAADDAESPWKAIQDTLRFQNIQLGGAELAGMPDIPAETEGVAIVAPKYDFTDEEIAVLERYWQRPKSALLILLQAGETPPKLRAFLRANGVTPRRDRIVSKEGERLNTTVRGTFNFGIDFQNDLAGMNALFEGASSSLEVREGATDLATRKISPVPLIQIAPEFWGETRFGEGNETFDEREDTKPPLHLAGWSS